MRRLARAGAAALALSLALAASASAATPVETGCPGSTTAGTTVTLTADCTTDQTLTIDDGYTLDGGGYTITAVDPSGGHFLGAVVTNGGASANVRNVTITASGLSDICDGGADRLRGILLDRASGTIDDVDVHGVRQGLSGCQEGNAIEARNFLDDGSAGAPLDVTVSDSSVSDYQKNGITLNGGIAGTVTGNTVTGDGPVDYIAQNGIQVGYGATAFIRGNTVSGDFYSPATVSACGLLFYRATGVKQQANALFGNQVDLCNYGRGGGGFTPAVS